MNYPFKNNVKVTINGITFYYSKAINSIYFDYIDSNNHYDMRLLEWMTSGIGAVSVYPQSQIMNTVLNNPRVVIETPNQSLRFLSELISTKPKVIYV